MARMHVPTGMRSRGDFQTMWRLNGSDCGHASAYRDKPLSSLYNANAPEVKLVEEDDMYWLMAELAGMHQDDITVLADTNTVRLQGEWSEPEAAHVDALSVRPYRAFARQFTFAASVEPDSISTTMTDGVLAVRIRKMAHAPSESPLARSA